MSVDPAQLTGVRFVPSNASVDPDGGAVIPYDFDVTIDNISFIQSGGQAGADASVGGADGG
jgi:hypothetical protein